MTTLTLPREIRLSKAGLPNLVLVRLPGRASRETYQHATRVKLIAYELGLHGRFFGDKDVMFANESDVSLYFQARSAEDAQRLLRALRESYGFEPAVHV